MSFQRFQLLYQAIHLCRLPSERLTNRVLVAMACVVNNRTSQPDNLIRPGEAGRRRQSYPPPCTSLSTHPCQSQTPQTESCRSRFSHRQAPLKRVHQEGAMPPPLDQRIVRTRQSVIPGIGVGVLVGVGAGVGLGVGVLVGVGLGVGGGGRCRAGCGSGSRCGGQGQASGRSPARAYWWKGRSGWQLERQWRIRCRDMQTARQLTS